MSGVTPPHRMLRFQITAIWILLSITTMGSTAAFAAAAEQEAPFPGCPTAPAGYEAAGEILEELQGGDDGCTYQALELNPAAAGTSMRQRAVAAVSTVFASCGSELEEFWNGLGGDLGDTVLQTDFGSYERIYTREANGVVQIEVGEYQGEGGRAVAFVGAASQYAELQYPACAAIAGEGDTIADDARTSDQPSNDEDVVQPSSNDQVSQPPTTPRAPAGGGPDRGVLVAAGVGAVALAGVAITIRGRGRRLPRSAGTSPPPPESVPADNPPPPQPQASPANDGSSPPEPDNEPANWWDDDEPGSTEPPNTSTAEPPPDTDNEPANWWDSDEPGSTAPPNVSTAGPAPADANNEPANWWDSDRPGSTAPPPPGTTSVVPESPTGDESEERDRHVSLELLHPAGRSPKIFNVGWIFGARCSVEDDQGVHDYSDEVRWSLSGESKAEPNVGRVCRPHWARAGAQRITLSVTVDGDVVEKVIPIVAVDSGDYAGIGYLGSRNPADGHGCPACTHSVFGPFITGSQTVTTHGTPAGRVGDRGIAAACCGPNTWELVEGDPEVLIDGRPAAKVGSKTQHCGGAGSISRY